MERKVTNQRYPDSGADRRVYPRSPVVVREARCICGMEVFFGYAQNISRSGLFIGTPKHRAPGSVYEIQFRLPGVEGEFRCKAKVVWTRRFQADPRLSPGFGLTFVDLPTEEADRIGEWVDGHLSAEEE